ncbi:MAG: CsgE family curli-type amyloid fiber assembly protein [Balneolaceae bacterium]|nr:CsgE family curli-type amyloid fiber assembly protein [Balneolaceae bacterium]
MYLSLKVILFGLLFVGSILFYSNAAAQTDQAACQNYQEYVADKGETLESISGYFGSSRFIDLIKSSNLEIFSENTSLDKEVVLKIPHKVYFYNESGWSVSEVLNNPFCEKIENISSFNDSLEVVSQEESSDTSSENKLEKFRTAFESLINEKRTEQQEEIQAKAEQQIFIELDGLVTDETRSKIGRDFYDIFYQKWEAPPNSSNFTIVISEQPTPSLGSLVSVSVNDEQVFRYRLQPRYEIIEQVANYAVQYTYNYMQENKHQYKIY